MTAHFRVQPFESIVIIFLMVYEGNRKRHH